MDKIPGTWFPEIFEEFKKLETITEIEKFSFLSQEQFKKNFAKKSRPFILTNASPVLDEASVTKVLVKSWKEIDVEMRSANLRDPKDYLERKLVKIKLSDYLEKYWKKDVSFYAGNNPIKKQLCESINLIYPAFYPRDFFNEPRMWLGPTGSVTPLHKDIPDNFALNYFGRKKWIIFAPTDFNNLYMTNPTPVEFPDLGVSLVNVATPNLSLYPLFAGAKPIEFILEPGEMLYLPAGWAHYVENIGDTLLFNFWLLRDKSPALLGRDV